MLHNLRGEDLSFFQVLAHAAPGDTSWRLVMPAFMVGELRRAFEMGFLLFLPFLVIDMVVASVLMSLGMMMLPPNVVSCRSNWCSSPPSMVGAWWRADW